MNILLTGGSGFVGKNLYQDLKVDFNFFVPRHKELDLLDYRAVEDFIKKNSIEIVIHSAVHSTIAVSRENGFEQDLRMLVSILRNIDHLKKFIFFGSGAEFDKTRDMKKVKEGEWGEVIPKDLYGFSKYLTQEVVKRDPKIINLRLFGIYGPYEDYRFKFISNSIVKNVLKLPIAIKQDVIFDYLYIKDLAPIVKHFLTNSAQYSNYNIAPDKSISLTQIITLINQSSEYQSEINVQEAGFNFEYTADNSRLRKEIPGLEFTSYTQGVKDLFKYYQSIEAEIDKDAIVKDEYLEKVKTKR